MPYLDKHLNTDEKIIYWCRPSRLAYLKEYLMLAIIVILTVTSLFSTFIYNIKKYEILASVAIVIFYALLLFSLVLLVRVEYKVWSRRYALTNKRVIVSEGIFSENFRSAVYDKITDIGLNQSFMDKVFNIGTISIDTAGSDEIELTFKHIAKPLTVKNKISEIQSMMPTLKPKEKVTKSGRKN